MKVRAYFAAITSMSELHEPKVILLMRDGNTLYGTARNPLYGEGDPVKGMAWFSIDYVATHSHTFSSNCDIAIDISAVIAVIPQ